MKSFSLATFVDGWLVGDFSPSILRTAEIEIGLKTFESGATEPCHFQVRATEITAVIEGEILLAGCRFSAGEVVLIEPGEHANFLSVSNSKLLVIKFPSVPADKIVCGVCEL